MPRMTWKPDRGLLISGEIDSELRPTSISPPAVPIDVGRRLVPDAGTSLTRGQMTVLSRTTAEQAHRLLKSIDNEGPFSARFPVGTKVKTLFHLGTEERFIGRGVIATVSGSDEKGIWITYKGIYLRATSECLVPVSDSQGTWTPKTVTICGGIFFLLLIFGAPFPIAFLLSICITGIFIFWKLWEEII